MAGRSPARPPRGIVKRSVLPAGVPEVNQEACPQFLETSSNCEILAVVVQWQGGGFWIYRVGCVFVAPTFRPLNVHAGRSLAFQGSR